MAKRKAEEETENNTISGLNDADKQLIALMLMCNKRELSIDHNKLMALTGKPTLGAVKKACSRLTTKVYAAAAELAAAAGIEPVVRDESDQSSPNKRGTAAKISKKQSNTDGDESSAQAPQVKKRKTTKVVKKEPQSETDDNASAEVDE